MKYEVNWQMREILNARLECNERWFCDKCTIQGNLHMIY